MQLKTACIFNALVAYDDGFTQLTLKNKEFLVMQFINANLSCKYEYFIKQFEHASVSMLRVSFYPSRWLLNSQLSYILYNASVNKGWFNLHFLLSDNMYVNFY